ncbi:MAG: glycosyltransferase [Betaproteobacteria bacterium]|nr:MAG: glycosyltransferase [Betaproteobacteria bacterium]
MNIFIVRRNRGFGGAERVAERIASRFETLYPTKRLWAGETYQGRKIPGRSGPPWWRSLRFTRHLDRLNLRAGKDNVVFSLEYGPDCDIYRAGDGVHKLNVRRRFGGSPRWMLNPWHWIAPRLERKCLESARAIIANSNLVKSLLSQTYPHLMQKIVTIYNGFDPAVFHPSQQTRAALRRELVLPAEGTMLLLSGSGFVRKGLHHCIELLARLRREPGYHDAHLVVIGKGDAKPFQAKMKSSNVVDCIRFVGAVDDPQRYYQAADFLVLPTRHDPFSNACLEALACGCPVLTSAENGAAEIVTPATGFVFEGRYDDAEFAAALAFIRASKTPSQAVADSVAHLRADDEFAKYVELVTTIHRQKQAAP